MKICVTCHQSYSDDLGFCPRDGKRLAGELTELEKRLAAGLARRFRFICRLGEGGMGTVFLAEQIALGNRPVAIKLLLRSLINDPEFLLRFNAEGASTARIHHPNVITVIDSGQADDGSPYIAMEYLEGETLHQALRERGALSVPETVEIVQQAARGLNAAHKLGIIHRDLKPDNLFLKRGDEGELVVKVMDFGIAKLRESATHTLTGMVLGTPAYMSFEQASGMSSEHLDARSDVYSLGVVVYEMLTGRAPFRADTPLGYVRLHMMEQPPPFRAIAPGLPVSPRIEWVVMKALKKMREERYQSPLEFARALADAAAPPPPTMDINKLFPSIESAAPPAVSESVAPLPRAASSADVAAQTPPPTAVAGRMEAPPPMPREIPPAPEASLPPAPVEPALVPLGPARPSWVKCVAAGLGLLILVALGIWHFYPRTPPAPAKVTSAPSHITFNPPSSSMVKIPGATFVMGRDNPSNSPEAPAHSVSVAAFQLDKRPVTNFQYAEFVRIRMHAPPGGWVNGVYPAGQADWPVTGVSWDDATAYCTSKGLRLPTEAEWEYAARGTDGRVYPWGNEFNPVLTNSAEAGLNHPEPVGAHPGAASPFGVFDMSGNVWEWTADDYQPYPGGQALDEIPKDAKVIRGGSYQIDKLHVTTTARYLEKPSTHSATIGFRCAR
jgi:serine/threonine-protein kinase